MHWSYVFFCIKSFVNLACSPVTFSWSPIAIKSLPPKHRGLHGSQFLMFDHTATTVTLVVKATSRWLFFWARNGSGRGPSVKVTHRGLRYFRLHGPSSRLCPFWWRRRFWSRDVIVVYIDFLFGILSVIFRICAWAMLQFCWCRSFSLWCLIPDGVVNNSSDDQIIDTCLAGRRRRLERRYFSLSWSTGTHF